jgi:predicted acetyltransferase
MDVEIRPVAEEEFAEFSRTVESAFGNQATEEETAGWRSVTELDRTLAVFDHDQIVATAAAFSFDLTLPGQVTIPAAGVTAVGVRPSHRRRGLLRSLMDRQLDDAADRGEPLAILTASESIIYGRFGYGVATSQASVTIDPRRSEFAAPLDDPGHIEMLEPGDARRTVPPIHDRARLLQAGDIARSSEWWDLTIADPDWAHPGQTRQFWAQHVSGTGQPDGYLAYRVKRSWRHGLPDSEIEVHFLVGLDAAAELALWRFALDLDLTGRVVAYSRPLDEPLRWRLADPRRLRTISMLDHVWARLLDIPKALGARTYGLDEQIVLDIRDPFRPETAGRYLLQTSPEGADCTRTNNPADISLGIAELGTAYLGQPRFAVLAGAGRATEHTPGALRRADRLFSGGTVPFCRSDF